MLISLMFLLRYDSISLIHCTGMTFHALSTIQIPITISRSRIKLGEEGEDEMVMGIGNDRVASAASMALERHRQGKKSKHKQGKRVLDTVAKPVKSVIKDDIFEDAGEYVPAEKQLQKRARWDIADGGDYFNHLRAEEEEVVEAEPSAIEILKGVKNLAAVSDRIGSRKQSSQEANGSAMDGEGAGYGETFDFDFAGEIESRDD